MDTKNIFLIDGASGTGKSDFVEYIISTYRKSGFLMKSTTREIRDYEKKERRKLDLKFCSKEKFDSLKLEYNYECEKHLYGFSKADLDSLVDKCENVFVIIRSVSLMRKLKREYKNHNVVIVYVHSDLSKIEERLKRQTLSKEQIKFRLSRIEATFKDYVLNSAFFDEVIVNNSDKDSYHKLIDNVIKKHT